MNFTSLTFFIFFPVVLLLYWLLPQKAKPVWLLLASYFFYAFLNFALIGLILSTTLVSYLCGIGMEKYPQKKKALLILCLVFCLGMLFVFKYLDFALTGINALASLFASSFQFDPLNLILPVGISFYTFQTLSYSIDVYKGKFAAEKNVIYYALYISFFPQLVAGPIEKPEHLLPQLKEKHHLSFDDFGVGLKYVVSGFIKKTLLADFLAIYVNNVYNSISVHSGFEILLATVFFSFEIYGDFAGYSEIAIGLAKWMGIDLTINFKRPYLSASIKEFWNRWHISLNDWFTEYIYIPLGGSQKGKARKYLNIFIVFLISGLWHGASLHFVLWGVLHGIFMILEDILSPLLGKMNGHLPKKVSHILSVCFTYLIVTFLWIFFRASSIADAGLAFTKVFTAFLPSYDLSFFTVKSVLRIILSFSLLLLSPYLPLIQSFDSNPKAKNSSYLCLYTGLVLILILAWLSQTEAVGESSFIYFQF